MSPGELGGPGAALESHLVDIKAKGRKALIVYLTGAFPDIEGCIGLMQAATEAGADLVELGIPFSDPVMDGPTIQKSSEMALAGGVTPYDVLDCVRAAGLPIPVALMTYYNPVFRAGPARFAAEASRAGVGGLIIPDLPLEESSEWEATAVASGIAPILLAAPNATDERLRMVCDRSRGFVYAISLLGVTGERAAPSKDAASIANRLTPMTELVVALGLGVSTPAQAAEAVAVADGVVVGSAVVARVLRADSISSGIESVAAFVSSLRSAMDGDL